jgi:segregation and condensation protein B
MTDENKDVLNQDNQRAMEQADTPVEETAVAGPAVQDARDLPADKEAQWARAAAEPENESPAAMDRMDAVTEESRTSNEAIDGLPRDVAELPDEAEERTSEISQTAREIATPVEESEAMAQGTKSSEPSPDTEEAAIPPTEPPQAPTVESVLEAVLFATDEPLTDSKLAGIVETTAKQVRASIESLNAKYEANNNAFRIEQIAGGYQMLTLNLYNGWLKKMLRARADNKLSPAAMETLAIIAYKQPIIRADIEAIRGVAVGEVIRSLMYKGLVKIVGRAEILGRPMLYGTTKKFLEVFGLNSLKDLPKAEELKNPDR